MMRDTWKQKYLCFCGEEGRKRKKIRKEQEKTDTHEPAPWTTTNALGKSKCRSTAASDKICMFTSSALLFPRLQSIFTKGERISIASRNCKAVIAKMDSLIVSSSVFWVIAAPPIKQPWNTKFSKPKTKNKLKTFAKLKEVCCFAPALWSNRRREGCVYETHKSIKGIKNMIGGGKRWGNSSYRAWQCSGCVCAMEDMNPPHSRWQPRSPLLPPSPFSSLKNKALSLSLSLSLPSCFLSSHTKRKKKVIALWLGPRHFSRVGKFRVQIRI